VTATTDTLIVERLRAGEPRALADLYDRYADRVYRLCWSVLRDDEAADASHDAFVVAWQRIGSLRDPAALRPWLFRIAWTQSLARRGRRGRWEPDGESDELVATGPGPEEEAARSELHDLVWQAAEGLSPQDQQLLDLHVRQGLRGEDLAGMLGVSPAYAHKLIQRLRSRLERSLGALLLARRSRNRCGELAEILSDWDGTLTPLQRKRIARHVEACAVCDGHRREMVSPAALLAALPVGAAPTSLRDLVLGHAADDHGPMSSDTIDLGVPSYPHDDHPSDVADSATADISRGDHADVSRGDHADRDDHLDPDDGVVPGDDVDHHDEPWAFQEATDHGTVSAWQSPSREWRITDGWRLAELWLDD
jgi:RNA polymerase sigma factor (sigma-70 family)